MSKDDNHFGVMLEDVNDKVDVIVEAVGQLQDAFGTLATKDELAEVQADVKVIKTALTGTNVELAEVKADVKVIKTTLTDTNIELTEVKLDVRDIKANVANTNQTLVGLGTRVTTLEQS